ncbi:hypothetical protein [Nocardioides sp. NPDC127503]|uniref:hypothetical protein n=1 Tax=Nocardioides sp. NPDC127503 TaxID=3154516 RepID=UPI00332B27B3
MAEDAVLSARADDVGADARTSGAALATAWALVTRGAEFEVGVLRVMRDDLHDGGEPAVAYL